MPDARCPNLHLGHAGEGYPDAFYVRLGESRFVSTLHCASGRNSAADCRRASGHAVLPYVASHAAHVSRQTRSMVARLTGLTR